MRALRALTTVLLLLILIPVPAALHGQEYSLFGEIGLEAGFLETPGAEQDNRFDSLLGIEFNHRLEYERFSFIARHRGSMDRREELDHSLYEGYLDFRPTEDIRIGAGKQRVSWGHGISFFPTDSLHPGHTREDVEGFTGISTLITPAPNLQLTGALDFSAPLTDDAANEDFYSELKYALYASWFPGNLDLALSGVYRRDETLRPGLGLSFELAGFILTAEGALEFLNQTLYPDTQLPQFHPADPLEPWPLAAAGISRSWMPVSISDFSFYAAAEYLYAGTGYSGAEAERYFEIISTYLGAGGSYPTAPYLGRHYLFLLGSLELYRKISFEVSGLTNIQDGSSLLGASTTLLTLEGIDLAAEGELLVGKSATEFGSQRAVEGRWSLTLKSTLYF